MLDRKHEMSGRFRAAIPVAALMTTGENELFP